MQNLARLRALRRLGRLGTWRLLLLVLSDPRWQPLFDSVAKRRTFSDRFRNPVPWFAWHCLPVLEAEVSRRQGERVVEWGTGASTAWFALKGMKVTGLEHDEQWFSLCGNNIDPEVDLRLISNHRDYSSPDVDPSTVSIWVIDGINRDECAHYLADHITQGMTRRDALIIFDDSNRVEYGQAIDRLSSLSTRHRSFTGPTSVELDKMTTFFWL